jgi:predicted small secreted protein
MKKALQLFAVLTLVALILGACGGGGGAGDTIRWVASLN